MLSIRKSYTRPTRPNCRNGVSSMLRLASPRRENWFDVTMERMRSGRARPLAIRRRFDR